MFNFLDNFGSKGIKNILNRFLEDPKDHEPEYNKMFKKNQFFSGNQSQTKKNNQLKPNNKKMAMNTPLISELSLNTTININNNSSVHPSSNTSYILSGALSKNSIKPTEKKTLVTNQGLQNMKKNTNQEKNCGEKKKNKSLSKRKVVDVSYNKENVPFQMNQMNAAEKRLSKHF